MLIDPVTGVTRITATSLPTDPSWMVTHTVATALWPSVARYDILENPTMMTVNVCMSEGEGRWGEWGWKEVRGECIICVFAKYCMAAKLLLEQDCLMTKPSLEWKEAFYYNNM